jgi:menaquinone-dependent protoporphyrinogen oxidase
MKVLVTAASKYGSTAEIAQAIGAVLAKSGLETTVASPQEAGSVEAYGAVVLGSAVYAGRWQKEAKELVERAGDSLTGRPVWLFSSGPIGDPPKPEEDPVRDRSFGTRIRLSLPSGPSPRGHGRWQRRKVPTASIELLFLR